MAAEFKSVKECVPATAVQDRENLTGKGVAAEGGMCKVKLDREGKVTTYMFWMLRAAGASAEEKKRLALEACADHPFMLSNPAMADQVADFRIRLLGL